MSQFTMSDLKKTAHGMLKQVVQTRMQIRQMNLDDIPKAVHLVQQNYDAEDAKLAMWEMMAQLNGTKPQPVYFAAFIDGTMIGCLGISDSHMDTRVYEIFWVNVLPDYQRLGVGKKLVMLALAYAVESKATMVLLTVKEAKMEFYRRLGFVLVLPIEQEDSTDYLMKARPDWALKMLQGRLGKESS